MVNVFATWCTACVNEIPDLVEVQNEMKSKGVNIVGVVTDTVDDTGENKEAIEKSKLIHEKTKASYPFLMPDKTNFNGRLNGIQAMPETFFVDSNGNIVGDTYSGAKSAKEWKQVIEKELEKIKNPPFPERNRGSVPVSLKEEQTERSRPHSALSQG